MMNRPRQQGRKERWKPSAEKERKRLGIDNDTSSISSDSVLSRTRSANKKPKVMVEFDESPSPKKPRTLLNTIENLDSATVSSFTECETSRVGKPPPETRVQLECQPLKGMMERHMFCPQVQRRSGSVISKCLHCQLLQDHVHHANV